MINRKAYINATGEARAYVLSHDVKQVLREAKAQRGLVNVLSASATTAVSILEGDGEIAQKFVLSLYHQFQGLPDEAVARRSLTGADKYHLMAAMAGLEVTLAFEQDHLCTNLQNEIYALDFEPKPGRREFMISVFPAPTPPAGKQK